MWELNISNIGPIYSYVEVNKSYVGLTYPYVGLSYPHVGPTNSYIAVDYLLRRS